MICFVIIKSWALNTFLVQFQLSKTSIAHSTPEQSLRLTYENRKWCPTRCFCCFDFFVSSCCLFYVALWAFFRRSHRWHVWQHPPEKKQKTKPHACMDMHGHLNTRALMPSEPSNILQSDALVIFGSVRF